MLLSVLFLLTVAKGRADLLRKSEPLNMPQYWLDQAQYWPHLYTWVSSSELIICFPNRATTDSPEGECQIYDLATRQMRDLPVAIRADAPFDAEVSPDGKHLLWEHCNKRGLSWYVSRLDGSGLYSWLCRGGALASAVGIQGRSYCHWTADNTAVTECQTGYVNRDTWTQVWVRKLTEPWKESAFSRVKNIVSFLDSDPDVMDAGNGCMLVPASLTRWKVSEPSKIVRLQTAIPKRFSKIAEPVVSPDRKRLLWECWDGKFSEVGSASKAVNREISLWVTSIDGTNPKRIGGILYPTKTFQFNGEKFGGFRWLPDGKSISFFYYRKFYKVAVPA